MEQCQSYFLRSFVTWWRGGCRSNVGSLLRTLWGKVDVGQLRSKVHFPVGCRGLVLFQLQIFRSEEKPAKKGFVLFHFAFEKLLLRKIPVSLSFFQNFVKLCVRLWLFFGQMNGVFNLFDLPDGFFFLQKTMRTIVLKHRINTLTSESNNSNFLKSSIFQGNSSTNQDNRVKKDAESYSPLVRVFQPADPDALEAVWLGNKYIERERDPSHAWDHVPGSWWLPKPETEPNLLQTSGGHGASERGVQSTGQVLGVGDEAARMDMDPRRPQTSWTSHQRHIVSSTAQTDASMRWGLPTVVLCPWRLERRSRIFHCSRLWPGCCDSRGGQHDRLHQQPQNSPTEQGPHSHCYTHRRKPHQLDHGQECSQGSSAHPFDGDPRGWKIHLGKQPLYVKDTDTDKG